MSDGVVPDLGAISSDGSIYGSGISIENITLASRYVDSDWYVARYSDVAQSGMDPRAHYIKYGVREGRCPNRYFNPREYCRRYSGVGVDEALNHWISIGTRLNNIPTELFDTTWYKSEYLAGDTDADPFLHFLELGEGFGFNPHPAFHSNYYRHLAEEYTGEEVHHPLDHFLNSGLCRKLSPNPLFDVVWYLDRYRDVLHSQWNPFLHYIAAGAGEGRMPNPYSDEQQFSVQLEAIKPKYTPSFTRLLGPEESRQGIFIGPLHPASTRFGFDGYEKVRDRGARPSLRPYLGRIADIELIAGTRLLIKRGEGVFADEWFDSRDNSDATQKYRNCWHLSNGHYAVGYNLKNGTYIRSGIHAMAEGDYNYFHFITEILPRVAWCDDKCDPSIPVLISNNLPSTFREALIACLPSGRPSIELERSVIYHIGDLFYPSDRSRLLDIYTRPAKGNEFFTDTEALGEVRSKILKKFNIGNGISRNRRGRKIYIIRAGDKRVLRNESSVVRVLINEGFEIIKPDLLSFESQVALFHDAALVVGPTGAAMTNLLWCSNNTKAVVLYSDSSYHQLDLWSSVCDPAGTKLHIVNGPRLGAVNGVYEVHDDFLVDPNDILTLVRELE